MGDLAAALYEASQALTRHYAAVVEAALEQVARANGWDGSSETKEDAAKALAHRVTIDSMQGSPWQVITVDGRSVYRVCIKWEGATATVIGEPIEEGQNAWT